MKTTLFLLAFSLFAVATKAQGTTTSLTIQTSAKCMMCKQTLEKNMAFERGVSKSSLDMKTKQLTVWYNPSKTTPAAIRKAVTLTGYDADSLQADQAAHDKLEPCCQKSSAEHHD